MSSASLPLRSPEKNAGKLSFFARYRDFLLSKETIFAFINAVLLLAGFIASISGAPVAGRWLYFASAVLGGMPLFILAARNVFVKRDITAGVMASVAMIAAILIGEYSAAAIVVFMFAIGDWLENLTMARANNALKDLARLVPPTVTILRDGQEVILPLEEVQPGFRVLVRSGERIGVDGKVLNGSASVNQAAITGESMPVEKKNGDEVYAGTTNEVGALKIEVTRTGPETTLGQIVRLVKEAQESQAPVQRVASKYARILVPVTFGIAILVYLLTGSLMRSITVLVVVCPCALVLATPTAVVASIGNAAKRGMLVKNGAVIEQVGRVDLIAFDKTGTLTHGKPLVNRVEALDGLQPDRLLALAAGAEQISEHPLGRAIVSACREKGLALPAAPAQFKVLPGFGVEARVENCSALVGSRALMQERGVAWDAGTDRAMQTLETGGETTVAVAVDGSLAGFVSLADQPRPAAKETVARLKEMGVEVAMVTGDNRRVAGRIAAGLGIERVFADVLPQDKLKIVRDLQSGGKKVAFVGDGVNDAPALAAADIGVAMGVAGTDVAMETASIGLMADEIERLPELIGLSKKALTVIRQNVIFSMSMNLLSVFLGGFGIIGPVVGAVMHEVSALPVLTNSARLINYHQKKV